MINKKYLPSKKFLIALSIAIGIVIITIVINYLKPNSSKYSNSLATSSSTIPVWAKIDSDNDGLPDWQEALYGTDPKKSDTDGDGTTDGAEVAQNRDPLKANTAPKGQEPNDKIDPAIIEKDQKVINEYQQLSATEKLSRDLISNILAAQTSNGPIDQSTANSIIAQAISELPKTYYSNIVKSTDLNLQKTDTSNLDANLNAYTKNYYNETQKLSTILGKDLELMNVYIINESSTTRNQILDIASKYQLVADNLIKMPVPVAIGYYDINYHLNIINDLEKIIAIDKDMVSSDKDAFLKIFSSLSTYNSILQDLYNNLKINDSVLKIQR